MTRKPIKKPHRAPIKAPLEHPETLLVGPFYYEIINNWPDKDADAADAHGVCDRKRHTIHIRESLNDQLRAEVLLHEVLHAIFGNSGLTHTDVINDREEIIINQLGLGLISLMRTNKDFIPYLAALLDRDIR